MFWADQQLTVVDSALADARAGRPTLLVIEGEPGQGKTTLLRELVRRADGFEVLVGQGDEGRPGEPYALLHRWTDGAGSGGPFQAAQALRTVLERLQLTGPALLVVDDLQWVDPESVESVAWVLQRAFGDRLLVVVATRPVRLLSAAQRLLLDQDPVTLDLTGLDLDQARGLLRQSAPAIDDALVQRLWQHTGGNPLYLRAIVREHQVAELATMEALPASEDLTRSVEGRLTALDPAAVALLRAVAVLGPGWCSLSLAASLAAVAEPSSAAEVLLGAGLVDRRSTGPDTQVRIVHSVLHASVLRTVPAAELADLHLRAAGLVASPAEALQHRVAATVRHDDTLAAELAAFAAGLHDTHAYRDAARFLRWSAGASAEPAVREQRWLDSLFESTLARDVDEVDRALADVVGAQDEVRRALVQGFALMTAKRWLEALRLLDGIDPTKLDASEPLVRFRVRSVRGWLRIATGVPGEDVLPDLLLAAAEPAQDRALGGYFSSAMGQARLRVADQDVVDVDAVVASAAGAPEVYRHSWGGAVYALSGLTDPAVRELEGYRNMVTAGHADLGDGGYHALLGLSLWLRGQWRRALVPIGVATGTRFGPGHPLVLAVNPIVPLTSNDAGGTRAAMAAARESLARAPWPQAIATATTVDVVALRLMGTPDERRTYLTEARRDLGPAQMTGLVPPLWVLHEAYASVWAGDLDRALAMVGRLSSSWNALPWAEAARGWVAGVVASARGVHDEGVALLRAARKATMVGLPVHQALVAADLAQAATAAGDARAAQQARTAVAAEYTALGAAGYLTTTTTETPVIRVQPDVWQTLSDREKEVVALLTEGLSYAQMARELFVTRSTVAFHLSNIYAKTNTGSRHELIALMRG